MSRVPRWLTIALGAAAVVALIGTGDASASVSATCGAGGQFETLPVVQLQGGSGSYSFNPLTFECAGTIDGTPDVFAVDVNTSGTYTNAVCGTGSLDSSTASGIIYGGLPAYVGRTFSFPYHVDLSGFVGQVTFKAPASGTGVVTLVPTGPYLDLIHCTSSFWMGGQFSLSTP